MIVLLYWTYTFQEIALLSQFEHDNIVQYVGTDKVSLYCFPISSEQLIFFKYKILYIFIYLFSYLLFFEISFF